MCPPTRSRILDYLRKHQTASVNDLSSILAMTGANVRHHLAVLESIDLIELITQRQEGRGRPVNIYGLSRRILGDGLDGLAVAMFEGLLREAPESEEEERLVSIAIHLGGKGTPDHDAPLPRRLSLAVDRLNELHYQARWEAGLDGPRIILGHCPYAAIIETTPELCRMDEHLLQQRSGLSVEQVAKLQPSTNGYPFCLFRVVRFIDIH
ncbi:MAG: helix-turn-helix domain-containing protein [Anaerolineales bacterium]